MAELLSPAGQAALRRLGAGHSLLAFDLDGTLAPLVPCRAEAAIPPDIAAHMQALAQVWPVAVITGRRIDDARARLGFRPRYLVGNHGAERPGCPLHAALSRQLDPCRALLRQQAARLREHGVELEDKGLSLALHYVCAEEPGRARAWLDLQSACWGTGVSCMHGHCVLNVTPAGAPDKGHALLSVMRHCCAEQALVVGDDSNDEVAFACAPRGSVSIRIGPRTTPTQARFRLESQQQMEPLLARLLQLWQ